jgi:alkyl hydroperoxide reductase subunit F
MYDLIIIGGGPAGMSAALYAARQKLNFLLITRDIGGFANYIIELKSYPGIAAYISGYELVKKFTEQLHRLNVPVREGEGVKSIKTLKGGFVVSTEKENYETKTILVATGRRFKRLEIKGEREFEGKGLSYCAVCDGPLFKEKPIAVIGGGRSGIYSSLFLLKIAKKIFIIEKEADIKESGGLKQAAMVLRESPKVEIVANAMPVEILGDKFAKGVRIKRNGNEETITTDAIFVEIGYEPNTGFLKDLAELNNRGEIIIDKNNMSDVPGIFAAGDVTDLHEKQVIVAVGEGAKAALSAIMYLEKIGWRE